MIVYRAVPYLLLAAPPAIFLLTILLGSCTMARTEVATERGWFSSDPEGRTGEDLQRISKDAQR